ncbi:outer membrane beta-barrel protein [Pedobacter insulae]|uniref:Outer membrane protein beta-barrel domain-containing protein n=1 Tax=Pedobacter insulae TaxID=414048 RepID=A0A1I2XHH1_9SPHI|nr:hypothetical protein [Pedobacter insulae]SFH12943.1 hypothetical protein SAMN04489864_105249 [Pedobacter insulae]
MKLQILSLLCGLVLIGAVTAKAQTRPIPPDKPVTGFRFGIGLEGALPMGDMKDLYNYKVGGGLTLRFSKGIAENLDVLLTGGAIGLLPEDLASETYDTNPSILIPVKLGARFMLGNNFYLMGEAGMTFTKIYTITNIDMTTGDVNEGFVNGSTFGYAPSIGVRFGKLDIGLRYETLSDINGGKGLKFEGVGSLNDGNGLSKAPASFLGLRIGFDF